MKPIAIALALTITMFIATAGAANHPTVRSDFDFGWRFSLGDQEHAEAESFSDTKWAAVDLPHDWSIFGPFDRNAPAGGGGAYLPTGIGWYRKRFQLAEDSRDRKVAIEFDGIYQNSEVWINGHSLGKRPCGYISFIYDLTPYLSYGNRDNVLAVRVDNSLQPNSRWYSGSGIYRHTWLLSSDRLHIPQWSTSVTTPQISSASATIDISVPVINERTQTAHFTLSCALLDRNVSLATTTASAGQLIAGERRAFSAQLRLDKPRLWSPEDPHLYTIRCELRDGENVLDKCDVPLGIRSGTFDVAKGFILNGRSVKLNGVCLHGDGGGVGAAVPEGVWMRRLKLLKEMGCNAIRTSHNPPAPELLDLCDQMGFLVMDEAFDEWEQGKRKAAYHLYFKEWSQRDLTDFIHRDRNHPSVVLWSAGNEIGEQSAPNGVEILKKLVDIFRSEDPSRPVTAACDRVYAEPEAASVEFLSQLDVVGYNYVDRWRERTNKYYSVDHQSFPQRKFIGTESSTMAGARGDYRWLLDTPTTQPTHSRYQRPPAGNTRIDVEQLWKFVRTNDYVAGDFMWTGIDYLGEASWPNKTALYAPLDTCGFKKDSYYFYQSQWTETPVVHLFPHWNLRGLEGRIIPVTCYTNCDTVELFLNGKSFGTKGYEFPRHGMREAYGIYPPRTFLPRTTSDLHLAWDVPYEPGTLKALGTRNGQIYIEEISTTGEPAAIVVLMDKVRMEADGRDVAHATVQVTDAGGRVVPTASDEITFELSGPARILSVDNGNPASDESFKADHRKAFNGLCLAIVQATRDAGTVRLTARAKGLRSASIELKTEPVAQAAND